MTRLLTILAAVLMGAGAQGQVHNQQAWVSAGGGLGHIGDFEFEFTVGELFGHSVVTPSLANTVGILQPLVKVQSLPVVLSTFEASMTERSVVLLHWTTASERGARLFEIQRSRDARNWQRIGEVAAEGESRPIREYRFADSTLISSGWQGIVYYRLKMVDRDGSYEFSGVRSVMRKGDTLVEVYPNPVQDYLHFRHFEEIRKLSIYDINGRIVCEGDFSERVDVRHLRAGMYLVKTSDGKRLVSAHRVLVVR